MSGFEFLDLSGIVNCVTTSLNHLIAPLVFVFVFLLVMSCLLILLHHHFSSFINFKKVHNSHICLRHFTSDEKNIAKGTTDLRVEFCLPKFKQVQTQILIKFHLQNLKQASTSKSQPKLSLSIKRKLQNLDQT